MNINTKTANLPLDQKTFDRAMANGAVNLTNRRTTKELHRNRKARISHKQAKTTRIALLSILILLCLGLFLKSETNATPKLSVEEKAFTVIKKYEGYSSKPYWDQSQWSCGYGMRCNENTTGITREKSKWYVIQRIKTIRKNYNLYQYDDNLEVALISFTYNLGHLPDGTKRFIKHGYINALKNRMKEYVYAGDQKLRGLVDRRNYETNLF